MKMERPRIFAEELSPRPHAWLSPRPHAWPAVKMAAAVSAGSGATDPGVGCGCGGGGQAPETAAAVVREYARDTTLHGIRYISRTGAPLWDRLCWAVAVVVSVGFASTFVIVGWDSFRNSPTVTNVENTHYPLHAFPFPAVTVCPANRVRRTVGMELLHRFLDRKFNRSVIEGVKSQLNGSLEDAFLNVMAALNFYQSPFYYRSEKYVTRIEPLLPYLEDLNISDFMQKALPPCESVFLECFWQGIEFDCCKRFHLQRTEAGFCYSYNSLSSENAKNCPPDLGLQLGPPAGAAGAEEARCRLWRNTASGTTSGLEAMLRHSADGDELPPGCQRDRSGFRVMVHHPSDLPEGGRDVLVPARARGAPHQVASLKVSAAATVGTVALKGLAMRERDCFFPDEKHLDIFRTYTLQNCLLDCRQRYLAGVCGCRTYFFAGVNKGVRDCSVKDLLCLSKQNRWLRFLRQPRLGDEAEDPADKPRLDCTGCSATCDDMKYEVSASFTDDDNPAQGNASAYLDIFYRDLGAVKYRKDVAFGSMQLLVSFGGILSLFLGVSLLSGVEFLYYLVRLVVAVWQGGCGRGRRDPAPARPPPTLPPVGSWSVYHSSPTIKTDARY